MKISKFWFFRFFPEFWKFIFSLTFSYKIFDFLFDQKFLTFFFDKIFFDRKLFSEKNLDHLFRSQIFQRFQKSYLEKSPMSLEIPKTQNPNFWSWIIGISMIFVHFYVALPLTYKEKSKIKLLSPLVRDDPETRGNTPVFFFTFRFGYKKHSQKNSPLRGENP